MTSAAYAIGSAAQQVYATESSTVGSIGVIMSLVDVTEADKANGYSYTILRSKEDKAIYNPHEQISSAVIDKNEMTKTIKFISGISGSHIFHIKTDGTEMTISSSSNDKGAVADKITLDEEIISFEVSFLVSHFIKVFEILSQDHIKLSFHDYNGYTICIVQEQSFNHIMFPME